MPFRTVRNAALALSAFGFCASSFVTVALGQQSAAAMPRITRPVTAGDNVRLQGNIRPDLALHADAGTVPDSHELHNMTLVLSRSAQRQAALDDFIAKANTPGAPGYHQWLTPQAYGERFGASVADLARVSDWLRAQGFTVASVSNNRQFVVFNGTAGQVRESFKTELHYFDVDGRQRVANVSAPQVPAAFAGVVVGVQGLTRFPLHAAHTTPRTASRDASTGRWTVSGDSKVKPAFTNGDYYEIAPGDFNKIYNVTPVFTGGTTGAGATVAVAEESDIEYGTVNSTTGAATGGDVATFRSKFGVNAIAGTLNMYVYHGYGSVTCTDPGIDPSNIGEDVEASLDAEWANAEAPAAKLIFMSCDDTTDGGVITSIQALIDNNLADVISTSYGYSELNLAATDYAFYDDLWQQAAAQGQSIIFSAGDSGSDVQDQDMGNSATNGLNVSAFAASPLVTSAGGTDFQDYYDAVEGGPAQSTYWSSSNSSTYESALSYVPETVWSEGCSDALFAALDGYKNIAAYCGAGNGNNGEVVGGSGGPSSHYALPSYQSGIAGLSSSFTYRVQPDISFFASSGALYHSLLYCDSHESGSSCSSSSNFGAAGGTSFVAPQIAGITGLLVSYTGQRQGVLNYGLYSLARQQFTASATASSCYANGQTANTGVTTGLPAASCTFNDVTTGDNDVQCESGSLDCYVTSGNTYGVLSTAGSSSLGVAYSSGPGYDAATGLGSVNVANLFTNWSSAFGSSTVLKPSSTSIASTASVTLTATVTASVQNGTTYGAATGTVTFFTNSTKIGGCTLSSATCFTSVSGSTLGPGAHPITAVYSGSKEYPGSTSSAVTVAVTSTAISTTTALTISPAGSVTLGGNVTLSATVSSASGNPTGTITFNVYASGQRVLTSGPLAVSSVSGTTTQARAVYGPLSTTGQPAGTYTVSAVYTPTGSYVASTSATSSYTLAKQTPVETVTPSSQTVTRPGNATLSATISGTDGTPTGTVTFTIPGYNFGTFPLSQISSGKSGFTASVATGSYQAGSYTIMVTYSGDSNYTSTSTTAQVTLK